MFWQLLPHLQYSVQDTSIEQQPQFVVHPLQEHASIDTELADKNMK